MISRQEILKGKILPDELEPNLVELLVRINKVRDAFGRPMTVTSGFRSMEDHLRIYHDKGIFDEAKIPMKSKHLYCQALDIYDPMGELNTWCKDNEKLLVKIGLWLEVRQGNWQHFQIEKFKSYKDGDTIWFNP